MSDNGARNVTTPRLGLNKPAVGADLDIWGDYLNSNCDTLDNSFLVTGGVFSGPVGGYPASTPGAPAFSVGSGAGIYAMGASMGVSSFNSNVFTFSLSNNTSAVPLSMANNRIMLVANPMLGTDAVNLNSLTSTLSGYLPLTGSPPSMLGPISMGGNLINNLALPQNPGDATSKQYVDALIADMRLFIDTWQVAANSPDISDPGGVPDGDYYIAVTANPSVPETAPANIPGIGGLTINNGDMVIGDAAGVWVLVRGGPLTVAEADALFVSKAGDTMSGGLTINSTSGLTLRQNPVGGVQGINYDGFGALGANIAFGVSQGVLYVYQNAVAISGLLNLTGGTMTGPLILSGDATQALGAATLQQVQGITGNYLPLSGGQLSGGLRFGSAVVGIVTDLSRHLDLFGGTYGISIASGSMNYIVPAGGTVHAIRSGGTSIALLGPAGVSVVTGNLNFGTRSGASVTDLSQHIALSGTTFGFNVAGGRMNYVATAPHFFITNAIDCVRIDNTNGLQILTGDVVLNRNATAPMQAVTLQQMQAAIGGGGDYLPIGGGTILGNLAVDGTLNVGALTRVDDLFSANNVQAAGGVFFVGDAQSYLEFRQPAGDWFFFTNNAQLARIEPTGSFYANGNVYANATATGNGFYLGVTASSGAPGRSVVFAPNFSLEALVSDASLNYWVNAAVAWGFNNTTHQLVNNVGPFNGRGAYINTPPLLDPGSQVAPSTYGLAEVLQLRPMSFAESAIIGFLPEDVQPVVPEAVVEVKLDGALRLGLRESALLAVTVNAIKELDARLRALEGGRYVQ